MREAIRFHKAIHTYLLVRLTERALKLDWSQEK